MPGDGPGVDGRAADRVDDCLRAALATLMQVHIVDVPDPRIRWDNRREFDLTRVQLRRLTRSQHEVRPPSGGLGCPGGAGGAVPVNRSDKEREAGDGFDGTWVAHPDSVPVATEAFDAVLGDRPNQVDRQRDDLSVDPDDLLSVAMTPGEVTEAGLRSNVNVGIQYLSSWLRGNGAAGIYGLMEDAATAEIACAQVWQWIRHGETLDDGRPVTPDLVRSLAESELEKIRDEIGDDEWFEKEGRPDLSRSLFERVALSGEEFVEFLTLPAYEEPLKLEGVARFDGFSMPPLRGISVTE